MALMPVGSERRRSRVDIGSLRASRRFSPSSPRPRKSVSVDIEGSPLAGRRRHPEAGRLVHMSPLFASPEDVAIPYLQRIRGYYEALGYGPPYEWAHYAQVAFHPLAKPLDQSRVALIVTAAPYQPDKGDQGPGATYNAAAKFYTVYSRDTAQEHDL